MRSMISQNFPETSRHRMEKIEKISPDEFPLYLTLSPRR